MRTKESEEMYLETILLLQKGCLKIRSIDIAERLGYSKPSVSRAMGLLKGKKYITIDNSGIIGLTLLGEHIATSVHEKHQIIAAFLRSIGATHEIAEQDACRIEHIISQELFEVIKKKTEGENINVA